MMNDESLGYCILHHCPIQGDDIGYNFLSPYALQFPYVRNKHTSQGNFNWDFHQSQLVFHRVRHFLL